MTAAHFPLLKPQQEEAHSASDAHTPVMNWVPGAFPEPAEEVAAGAGAAATLLVAATFPLPPAAAPPLAFGPALGVALPKPHPPSLSCAGMGAAHFPLLKPQHTDAQSASDVQAPVMN